MKKLNELLSKKLTEIESEEKEFFDKSDYELKIKEQELVQQKELERIARNKASLEYAWVSALGGGFFGLILGALLGFGKGCAEYSEQNRSLLQPFWYIPETMFTFCIIGAIIGALVGLIKGQVKGN